jgi:hypothetical protein
MGTAIKAAILMYSDESSWIPYPCIPGNATIIFLDLFQFVWTYKFFCSLTRINNRNGQNQ